MTDCSDERPSLDAYVRALVDTFPPVSDETRARLAALLRPPAEPAAPQRNRAA